MPEGWFTGSVDGKKQLHVWLNPIEFDATTDGKKPIETRAWSSALKYEELRPRDTIIFHELGSKLTASAAVTGVRSYTNIRECLEREGLERCLPWIDSIDEGIRYITDAIRPNEDGDAKQRIATGGVFAIEVRIR